MSGGVWLRKRAFFEAAFSCIIVRVKSFHFCQCLHIQTDDKGQNPSPQFEREEEFGFHAGIMDANRSGQPVGECGGVSERNK